MQIFAYLDPGTGSLILQAIIGAIAGAAFFFKGFWAKLKYRKAAKKSEQEQTKDKKDTDKK